MTADDPISIVRFLPHGASLDQSEADQVASVFDSVYLKQDEFFIKTGDPVTKVAFIAEGLLCRFSYDRNGNKIIDQFLCENHFFSDRKGYFFHQPSFTTIKAIIPCHLWTIPIHEIEALKKINPKFNAIITEIIHETLNHD